MANQDNATAKSQQRRPEIRDEFVFTWETELRIERSRRMKISFRIEARFRFMYQQSYFSVILALIHLNTWIKFPILQTIFISAIMNIDFISSFIQEWNFDPSLQWFRIDIAFRNCSIRNKKCNEIDPEWVARTFPAI